MKATIRGVYHGDRIELKDHLELPLGTDVRMNIERVPWQGEHDVTELFGTLRDRTFAKAVEAIVNDRDSLPTQPPVDFDAAS